MSENLKVSIILPTYNGSKYIRQSIDSCLNQTFKNFELIIVDDCSTDNTPEIIKSYADPRIRYIRNQNNQRLPRSLNIGFAQARGEYLTWTSDDNEFLPTALEEMLLFLQKHPEIDFVYADVIVRDHDINEETQRRLSDLNLEHENNAGACYLYTRKVYETVGDYNPNWEWVEDYDYWIRISKKFRARYYSKSLYIYGHHREALTSRKYYQINVISNILKYSHGYITFGQLLCHVGNFHLFLEKKILKDKKELFEAWSQIIPRVFRVSRRLGISFVSLLALLFAGKFIKKLFSPILVPYRTARGKLIFRLTMSGLKTGSPSKINVLCSVPELVMGGSEKVMQDVVSGLKSKNFQFHLISKRKQNNAWCRNFAAQFLNTILLGEDFDSAAFMQYVSPALKKLDIKLILTTNSHQIYKALPVLRKQFPGLKIVDILHLEKVGGCCEMYVPVAHHIDRRICISRHLKEFMENQYREFHLDSNLVSRIQVIHNGIDANRFVNRTQLIGKFKTKYKIPQNVKIITFAARFAPEKRPFLFIDIAQELMSLAGSQTLQFVMAGSGLDFNKIKNRITASDLKDHFILPGIVTTELPELLADTFLLFSTSTHEGIPLIIQEAMLMGVPAISTNVGAIYELIEDGQNGHLVDYDDQIVDHFIIKTMNLLNNEGIYRKMSENARNTILSEYSLTGMIDKYLQSLSTVLNLNHS